MKTQWNIIKPSHYWFLEKLHMGNLLELWWFRLRLSNRNKQLKRSSLLSLKLEITNIKSLKSILVLVDLIRCEVDVSECCSTGVGLSHLDNFCFFLVEKNDKLSEIPIINNRVLRSDIVGATLLSRYIYLSIRRWKQESNQKKGWIFLLKASDNIIFHSQEGKYA